MYMLYLSFFTLIATAIGAITGFGTSTLMIPVLVIFFPPVEAIFFVSIIHWFGNVWRVGLFRSGLNWRLFVLFGGAGLVTSYLGAYMSLGVNERFFMMILGVFLMGYSLFLVGQSQFKIPTVDLTAVSGGALSGFFAGMFGMGGAIRSLFLVAYDLPKAMYIATGGAIGLLVDSTRIVTYVAGGATLPRGLWYGLLVCIPISFVGTQIAKRIVGKIPQNQFRMVVSVFLFMVGLKLVLWP